MTTKTFFFTREFMHTIITSFIPRLIHFCCSRSLHLKNCKNHFSRPHCLSRSFTIRVVKIVEKVEELQLGLIKWEKRNGVLLEFYLDSLKKQKRWSKKSGIQYLAMLVQENWLTTKPRLNLIYSSSWTEMYKMRMKESRAIITGSQLDWVVQLYNDNKQLYLFLINTQSSTFMLAAWGQGHWGYHDEVGIKWCQKPQTTYCYLGL